MARPRRENPKPTLGVRVEKSDVDALVYLSSITGRTITDLAREGIRVYVLQQLRVAQRAAREFERLKAAGLPTSG